MGATMGAAVKLELQVLPPSVDLAAMTTLLFKLVSLGLLTPTDVDRAVWVDGASCVLVELMALVARRIGPV
jgi:hypothetical protein